MSSSTPSEEQLIAFYTTHNTLTQKDFAAKFGGSASSLSRFLSGKNSPTGKQAVMEFYIENKKSTSSPKSHNEKVEYLEPRQKYSSPKKTPLKIQQIEEEEEEEKEIEEEEKEEEAENEEEESGEDDSSEEGQYSPKVKSPPSSSYPILSRSKTQQSPNKEIAFTFSTKPPQRFTILCMNVGSNKNAYVSEIKEEAKTLIETWQPDFVTLSETSWQRNPESHVVPNSMIDFYGDTYFNNQVGLLIRDTFNTSKETIEDEEKITWRNKKVSLDVEVSKRIILCVVHFENSNLKILLASYHGQNNKINNGTKREQVEHLLILLEKKADGNPIICCGDFNLDIREVAKEFGWGIEAEGKAMGSSSVPIDFIITKNTEKVLKFDSSDSLIESEAMDHYPIKVDFYIHPEEQ